MTATYKQLREAKIVSRRSSIYEEIKDKPGVYYLDNLVVRSVGMVVVMKDLKAFYVKESAILNLMELLSFRSRLYYLTNHEVPDVIELG